MSLNDVVAAEACADDCEAGGAGLVAEVEADAPFLPRAVRRGKTWGRYPGFLLNLARVGG
jgi:hypothetical protein